MYEDEDFPDVPDDVLQVVELLEQILDGVYDEECEDYLPLNFNED